MHVERPQCSLAIWCARTSFSFTTRDRKNGSVSTTNMFNVHSVLGHVTANSLEILNWACSFGSARIDRLEGEKMQLNPIEIWHAIFRCVFDQTSFGLFSSDFGHIISYLFLLWISFQSRFQFLVGQCESQQPIVGVYVANSLQRSLKTLSSIGILREPNNSRQTIEKVFMPILFISLKRSVVCLTTFLLLRSISFMFPLA